MCLSENIFIKYFSNTCPSCCSGTMAVITGSYLLKEPPFTTVQGKCKNKVIPNV